MSLYKLLQRQPPSAPSVVEHEQAIVDHIEQRELIEAVHQLTSQTRLIANNAVPPVSSGGKRKRFPDTEKLLIPPIPERNGRTPGGMPKARGVVFRATYDCSTTLVKTLSCFSSMCEFVPLMFTDKGLSVQILGSDKVAFASVFIPASSFMKYENLAENVINVTIAAEAVEKMVTACSPELSFTFMYDQYSNPDEPLHVMLYPRTESSKDDQVLRKTFRPCDVELNGAFPDFQYQYRVHVDPRTFSNDIKELKKDARTISLVMNEDRFELSCVSKRGDSNTNFLMNAIHVDDGKEDEEMISSTTRTKRCIVQRLKDADPSITIGQLSGYKISAAQLRNTCTLADMAACTGLTLQLGLIQMDGTEGLTEIPIYLRFAMRSGTIGPFKVEWWIAPRESTE